MELTLREMVGLVGAIVLILSIITWYAERADRRDRWRAAPSRYQAHPIVFSRLRFVGVLALLALVLVGVVGQGLRRIGILP